ncbi:hypothetical protein HMH01_08435 [Halovulum dunhuangense]|uniref:Uncharacterized protein n=1 Tax=Halovulum dunhuangense TaxID=1505036 RepID=A0A849L2C0_9RHOB|nr:hypothetical protein [Halovulum dunhuangense]NNU80466.1 hypothetical protein [Halovulum dunhuangense]
MNTRTLTEATTPAPLSGADRDVVRTLAFVALTVVAGHALAALIGAAGLEAAPAVVADWHGNVAASR